MSANVDVLAVIRARCPDYVGIAVAELIEADLAVDAAVETRNGWVEDTQPWHDANYLVLEALKRRAAALARVQGGQS